MPQESPPHEEIKNVKITQVSYVNSLWVSYVVSVLAAWVAEFATYPLDLVKTRLQIQGEIANKPDQKLVTAPPRGMMATAIGIAKEEGIPKLWQGVSVGFMRHVVYSGFRIVIYQTLRDDFFKKQPGEEFPMWKAALCGISAGSIAQFLSSPADLLKVQYQMEGKRRLMGFPPRVHGVAEAIMNIVKTGGVRALWKGAVPNTLRASCITIGDISGYDYSKRVILANTSLEDSILVHILASFLGGFTAAALGTPADVIKARIMNQPVDKDGRPLVYKSTIDCIVKSLKNEGVLGLYKGFTPLFWRLAPWSMTFWISYEFIMRMGGAQGWK